ncbi:unnamed protein product [Symbiodinium natans]|uniref:Uncharacterized protein n=1 Tax=Symbiodinium natans TaxID=878477 RepID=A0A812ILT6_9DINO|nr:unnamed protein product [Symbiodinium natans]
MDRVARAKKSTGPSCYLGLAMYRVVALMTWLLLADAEPGDEESPVVEEKSWPLHGASWNLGCHVECRNIGFGSSMCESNGVGPGKYCNCYKQLHITRQTCDEPSSASCLLSCRSGCTSVGYAFGVVLRETGHCCCYADWKPLSKKCET